jgi:hypothetical protein
MASATLKVEPGQKLYVEVGGMGQGFNATNESCGESKCDVAKGGFNGGGESIGWGNPGWPGFTGGGGGGASEAKGTGEGGEKSKGTTGETGTPKTPKSEPEPELNAAWPTFAFQPPHLPDAARAQAYSQQINAFGARSTPSRAPARRASSYAWTRPTSSL